MARPSSYTEALGLEICERIVDSDYGLEQICEADDLPSVRTVFRWLEQHEEFRQQYARAKVLQGHIQAGRAVKAGTTATDASLGRLAYDARRWHAGKLNAKEYGDKIAHVGGDDTDPAIKHSIQVEFIAPKAEK